MENESGDEGQDKADEKKSQVTAATVTQLCVVGLIGATAFVGKVTALVTIAHEIGVL
jgi:hypothetical protein